MNHITSTPLVNREQPIERFRTALQAAGKKPFATGSGWACCCPAHEDRKPSLTFSEGADRRVLLRCHRGCTAQQVCQAIGLELQDLWPGCEASPPVPRNGTPRPATLPPPPPPATAKPTGKVEAFDSPGAAIAALERNLGPHAHRWNYCSGDGELVGAVIRWDTPKGKEIRPVSRDGTGWRIGAMPEPRPLYRLGELQDSLEDNPDQVALVVEGEKACEAARALGFVSVTSSGGANASAKTDWSPLRGRTVTIWPDNDDPGAKYAQTVAELLLRLDPPAAVRIIEPPAELPVGGDVVDYAELHGDQAAVRGQRLIGSAQPVEAPAEPLRGGPVLVRLSDVQPESVEWLWPGRFAMGKLSLLVGDPGRGKSFITIDMAARVSTGRPWTDALDQPNPAGGVVLLSAEDDVADTIRPRLDAAEADCERIVALQAIAEPSDDGEGLARRTFNLMRDLRALERAIDAVPGCRLVVVDPVSSYLGGVDSHKNSEVRVALAGLAELAARRHVAVVAVTHLNKASNTPAMYRAMGSLAFVAASRSSWVVCDSRGEPGQRLMLPLKNNLAPEIGGLAYRLQPVGESAAVHWEAGRVDDDVNDALTPARTEAPDSALGEAIDWLREQLSEGAVATKDITSAARADGIAWRTVRRAKDELGINSRKAETSWVWELANLSND